MTARALQDPRFGVDLRPSYLMGLRPTRSGAPHAFASGAQSTGGRIVQRAGRGQEVFDLRAYVDGDDPRHLDHRATARKGRPHIKRYHEERNTKLLMVLDLRPAMFFGLRRAFLAFAAAEALVLRGWAHLANQGLVGLYAFTNTREAYIRPKPRDQAMQRLIGEICTLYALGMEEAATGAANAPLDERLTGALKLSERGAMVLLASGFDQTGARIEAVINQMRHRQYLSALYMNHGALAALPTGHYPVINENAERSQLTGFSEPNLPPYLDQRRDQLVDAGLDPRARPT